MIHQNLTKACGGKRGIASARRFVKAGPDLTGRDGQGGGGRNTEKWGVKGIGAGSGTGLLAQEMLSGPSLPGKRGRNLGH